MEEQSANRNNPSRSTCESTIRRILMTEFLQNGKNIHFKNAMDFMSYFESLYPAGPSLTKQIQRAIKSMNLAKDENGFFLIDKTKEQVEEDKELKSLFKKTNASLCDLNSYETVFLKTDPTYRSSLLLFIEQSSSFENKYLTLIECSNGILFLTNQKDALLPLLDQFISPF